MLASFFVGIASVAEIGDANAMASVCTGERIIERVDFKDGSLDIHWREDGWIGLDPSIVAHPYVEEAKEYAEEVMA